MGAPSMRTPRPSTCRNWRAASWTPGRIWFSPITRTCCSPTRDTLDRKSTRLNSSHQITSYAVFCLKTKKQAIARRLSSSTSSTSLTRRSRRSSSAAPCAVLLRTRSPSATSGPCFFFTVTTATEIYTLSLHDALPISPPKHMQELARGVVDAGADLVLAHHPHVLQPDPRHPRSEEHTSELQSPDHLVCRLLLENKKTSDRASFELEHLVHIADTTLAAVLVRRPVRGPPADTLAVCDVGPLFFFHCYHGHRDLHSFPTRRSSDLPAQAHAGIGARRRGRRGGSGSRPSPARVAARPATP